MQILDLLWHFGGFALPALVLAPGMVLAGQFLDKKRLPARVLTAQAAIHFVVLLAVLLAGLVLTGRDGRMLTYGALVLASASTQWALGRWRIRPG